MMRATYFSIIAGLALFAGGCTEIQSVLHPTGPDASRTYVLAIVLFSGGAAILALVVTFTWLAIFGSDAQRKWLSGEHAVVLGGIALPAVTLTALLIYGAVLMGASAHSNSNDALKISIEGRQWWWRVTYVTGDGAKIESANEIRVPAGQRVELSLTSPDVIHSFWAPILPARSTSFPDARPA